MLEMAKKTVSRLAGQREVLAGPMENLNKEGKILIFNCGLLDNDIHYLVERVAASRSREVTASHCKCQKAASPDWHH